nr:hypothetical protein [uncultured Flavobacterium sp.]
MKTKKSLIIFTFLFVILIPYSVIFFEFDFAASIIPGWHTTINSFNLIANLIKLIALFIVLILYWKLSNFKEEMKIKVFILHLILTIPSIFISKIPLSNFINFNSRNVEETLTKIENLNRIVILINILFLIGQILFGIYYYKMWKSKH